MSRENADAPPDSTRRASTSQEIEARIASFPTWYYEFELAGHTTPITGQASHRNRQRQRDEMIFGALRQLYGGSLAGKRILDLGCNAGYWSLRALEEGADYVFGIDGRQTYIDQAGLVFEVKGVERSRYEFATGDVFEAKLGGPYEVVLCLGLLYHVTDPVMLLERISQLNTETLVIDTSLSLIPGRFLKLRAERASNPFAALRDQYSLYPSRQAVISLAESVGYAVSALAPRFTDYVAGAGYEQGTRRAFLCAKDAAMLDAVADRSEPTTTCRLIRHAVRGAIEWGRGQLSRHGSSRESSTR